LVPLRTIFEEENPKAGKRGSSYSVSLADIEAIFLNIEDIYMHHHKFLENLRKVVENWHETALVGHLFIDMVFFIPKLFLRSKH